MSSDQTSDGQDAPVEQRSRPTLRGALLSLPFLSNSICGWLLLGCFWIPFGVGCDRQAILVPADDFQDGLPNGIADWLALIYLDWPYFFGGLFAMILATLAIRRPRHLVRWLVPLPISILVGLLLFAIVLVLLGETGESVVERMILGLYSITPPAAVLLWAGLAYRSGNALLAATRSICGLALIMPMTFYAHGAVSFVSQFLIGFYLSIGISVALTICCWFLYTQGERSFCDVNAPKRRVQFRIRTLMVWTLLVAGISAIIQNLSD